MWFARQRVSGISRSNGFQTDERPTEAGILRMFTRNNPWLLSKVRRMYRQPNPHSYRLVLRICRPADANYSIVIIILHDVPACPGV
jgi:hypothetical protein